MIILTHTIIYGHAAILDWFGLVGRKPVSRWNMVKILLSLEKGSHVNDEKVEFYECVSYRLEPMTSGSFNDLDGEHIESGPIQAQIQPGAIRMFA